MATVFPARTGIDPARASTIGARRCANGCDTPPEIGTKHAMTEVTNHIQVLLNLIGRSEHFCPQYNDSECVMNMTAEMGSSCKTMIRSGISFDKLPNGQKTKGYLYKCKTEEQLCWNCQEEEQTGQAFPTFSCGS